jgi:hypothetical protein
MVDSLELGEGGLYAETYHVSGRKTGEAKPHVLYTMLQAERPAPDPCCGRGLLATAWRLIVLRLRSSVAACWSR